MQTGKSQKNPKKNRCTDAAAQQGENFALQNSRQESENPGKDFWFHIFGSANSNLSEKSKKNFRWIRNFFDFLL